MTRIARLVLVLMVLGVIPCVALAQDALARRVSLDLKAMAPAEAFKVLADAVGRKVSVDPAVTTPVDIVVRNVSARTALNTMCESIGCRWVVEAGSIVVKPADSPDVKFGVLVGGTKNVSPQARATRTEKIRAVLKQPLPAGLKFDAAPLSTVSERLGEALGVKMRFSSEDPSVGTVTGDFSHKTIQGVLEVLVAHTGSKRVIWRVELDIEGEKSPTVAILSVVGPKTVTKTVKKSVKSK